MHPDSEKQGEAPLKDLGFMAPNLPNFFFPEARHANVLLLISSKHTYHSLDLPSPKNMEGLSQIENLQQARLCLSFTSQTIPKCITLKSHHLKGLEGISRGE